MSRVTLVVNRHGTTSETFQRSLAALLVEGGHEVTIHALRGTPGDVLPKAPIGASQAWAPAGQPLALAGRLARSSPRDLRIVAARARARFGWGRRGQLAAALAAPLHATRPEVVHVGFSGIGIALADALDLLEEVPVVVSCRGTDELVRPLLDPDRPDALRRLFARATVVHAVAGAVADAVVELGADPSTVAVIRPAVDLAAWTPGGAEPDGPPWQLVTVTRLVDAKGVDDLVSALAIVVSQGIDARLRIVGDGPGRDGLRLRAARAGLAERVTLVGAQPPEVVRREVADAHLFVCPSLSEGINNGVLEAMALGVAVLSTDVGGMAEVIRPGTDGWLVPPSRPDLLAAAVVDALGDDARRGLIAGAGRDRVTATFGLERQAAEWLAVYAEIGDRAGGPGAPARGPEGST